ncbi:MAG TPA: class I SAM-dependent methyltransferase [Acidimicrobiales bacterium]|nr:class I SAM-dependent methyltransferase [Acidimicrobiales bacterium]
MRLADLVSRALGPEVPISVRAYDGSDAGPPDAVAALVLNRPEALQRFVMAPGELGLGRAYVAGDLDAEGDLFGAMAAIADHPPKPDKTVITEIAKALGPSRLRPLPPPPEEARLRGLRHSKARDAQAIAHHYDVSNDFYRIVLGPSLTYSCAVWTRPDIGLEAAQANKHELVSIKLGLEPGMRLLDVGCGWGGMVLHAAARHGVRAVGVTISERQADLARKRVADAGLTDLVEIRLQDYRDVEDGPYDAVSSIGMFEHVGFKQLHAYFGRLFQLLRPEGRLLNHAIGRPATARDRSPVRIPAAPWQKRTFIDRFVFPDGELHEVGTIVSAMQLDGFEVRHLESLREHYGLTLRAWVANLEGQWDEAVRLAGEGRARVWRLYMAASAVGFEAGRIQVHQVLAVKPAGGSSGVPLRPRVELATAPT